jgi:hypothetical protein
MSRRQRVASGSLLAVTFSLASVFSADAQDLTELKGDEQGADVLGVIADSFRLLLLELGSPHAAGEDPA